MFWLDLSSGKETRQYVIRPATEGWELEECANWTRIRSVRFHDWHRVERAIALIRLEVERLEREGWIAASLSDVETHSTNR
jgi:hypothetical protein